MDILSDILATVTVRGSLYFRTELGAPWAVRIPPDRNTVRFHLMVAGECWVSAGDGGEAVRLAAGDFVVIPHGAAQVLADVPGRAPVRLGDVLKATGYTGEGTLRFNTAGNDRIARMICGFCTFDAGADHPLLRALPGMLLIRSDETLSFPWLADAVRFLTFESQAERLGGGAIVDRLSEILFVQAVRVHVEKATEESGFAAGLADPRLSRALAAFHAAPGDAWTLDRLAGAAGLSRSRFAELFRRRIGQPPAQYLTEWRLQKARHLLAESRHSVAEVAHRVGYQSLPSFSRTFKRHFGVGPGRYRKVARAG